MTLDAFAAPLRQCIEIDVVATVGHAEALKWDREWAAVDMVIVDAADEQLTGDQFPGVGVVRRVRMFQGDARPNVMVVTGHFFNDGLRRCMAEVGADFFFLRSDLRTLTSLVDAVLHPDSYRRGVPPVADQATTTALGITGRSRVSELVNYVTRHGLEPALDPTHPDRTDPRSRRWYRHRQAMAVASKIQPVNLSTGQAPNSNQRIPSWRQLSHVHQWATKIAAPANNWTPVTDTNSPPNDGKAADP